MGRKRKIPKESKSLKYMYFIKVNLHNEDTLKFGISNITLFSLSFNLLHQILLASFLVYSFKYHPQVSALLYSCFSSSDIFSK